MNAYIQLGWVLPPIIEKFKGIEKSCLDSRRKNGKIPEGIVWKKAPDGRIYYHFERWDLYVEDAL